MLFLVGLVWILGMSLVLLMCMYHDKERARSKQWRISEKTLFTLAVCGGALGGLLGMYSLRHKIKKTAFKIGFPLITVVHVLLLARVI